MIPSLRPAAAIAASVTLLLASGCGKDGHDHGHDHAAPSAAATAAPVPTNRIPVPSAVVGNLGITFATVEPRVVQGVLRIPGRFEADADAHRDYPMPLAGAIEVLVKPYQHVAAGQPLYRVSGQAWAQTAGGWDEAHQAAADSPALARRRDLIAATVAQMAGLPADAAGLSALRAAPALTVHARAPGVVAAAIAVSGGFLAEGTPAVAVVDPARVRFRAVALQGDLARLSETMPAAIVPITASHSDRLPARVAFGLEADAQTRTIELVAWPTVVARPRWARAGIAALLEVRTAGGDEELAIPLAATIRDGLKPILFRRDPAKPDEVIRLDADLGADDGVWVQVLSGLKAGDTVVVGGIYPLLLSGAGKASAGHFHSDGTFHEGKD